MSRRTAIRGVLNNFLGTFKSRYSDFKGYWLFGFLVADLNTLQIDLLEWPTVNESTPTNFTRRLAVQRFRDQMNKAGLPIAWVREARLDISKVSEQSMAFAGGRTRPLYDVRLDARVTTDLGKVHVGTTTIRVAPHDPTRELQSISGLQNK